jgi:hypothetical protein
MYMIELGIADLHDLPNSINIFSSVVGSAEEDLNLLRCETGKPAWLGLLSRHRTNSRNPTGIRRDIENELNGLLYRLLVEDRSIPLEELNVEIDRDDE